MCSTREKSPKSPAERSFRGTREKNVVDTRDASRELKYRNTTSAGGPLILNDNRLPLFTTKKLFSSIRTLTPLILNLPFPFKKVIIPRPVRCSGHSNESAKLPVIR